MHTCHDCEQSWGLFRRAVQQLLGRWFCRLHLERRGVEVRGVH